MKYLKINELLEDTHEEKISARFYDAATREYFEDFLGYINIKLNLKIKEDISSILGIGMYGMAIKIDEYRVLKLSLYREVDKSGDVSLLFKDKNIPNLMKIYSSGVVNIPKRYVGAVDQALSKIVDKLTYNIVERLYTNYPLLDKIDALLFEKLDFGLDDLSRVGRTPGILEKVKDTLPPSIMKKYVIDLLELIIYLRSEYDFVLNDLHEDNIMFNRNGDIVVIDYLPNFEFHIPNKMYKNIKPYKTYIKESSKR